MGMKFSWDFLGIPGNFPSPKVGNGIFYLFAFPFPKMGMEYAIHIHIPVPENGNGNCHFPFLFPKSKSHSRSWLFEHFHICTFSHLNICTFVHFIWTFEHFHICTFAPHCFIFIFTSLFIFKDLSWGSSSRAYMITSEKIQRHKKCKISFGGN